MSTIGKSMRHRIDYWLPGAGLRGEWEMTTNRNGVDFLKWLNWSGISDDSYTTLWIYQNPLHCTLSRGSIISKKQNKYTNTNQWQGKEKTRQKLRGACPFLEVLLGQWLRWTKKLAPNGGGSGKDVSKMESLSSITTAATYKICKGFLSADHRAKYF